MSLEMFSKEMIDAAGVKYLSYGKDETNRGKLIKIGETFHECDVWEGISALAENSIKSVTGAKQLNDEQSHAMHVMLMELISVGFVAGFDAGYKLQVEQTVGKFGGLA